MKMFGEYLDSINIARWGGIVSMVSGVLWILYSIVAFLALLLHLSLHLSNATSKTVYDYVSIVLYSCALLTLIGVPLGLHVLQAKGTREPGVMNFLVIVLGAVLASIGSLVGYAFDVSFMAQFVYVLGFIILLIGMLIFAFLILIAGLLPWRYSVMIVVGLLGLFLVAAGGGIVLGILWIVIGYFLWSGRAMMSLAADESDRRKF